MGGRFAYAARPMGDRRELAEIFCGGALGALLRAGLVEAAGDPAPAWPWATFGVNVAGAFLLGVLVTLLSPGTRGRPFFTTGFCGALTTFSTVQVEVLKMLEAGRLGTAALYVGGSVLAGLGGVHLATRVAGRAQLG
jgi:fluoride exporter